MNANTFHILRILMDSRVTGAPRRVLKKLRQKGNLRVPEPVQTEIEGRIGTGLRSFNLVRKWLSGEMLTRHNGRWVLNSFLPPFPSPAFDRMFENLLSGRHLSPVSAFLAITDHCPYDCRHCSLKGRREGNLDTEAWLKIIEDLHSLGASLIGFTGGEPFCRTDLSQLVRAAKRGGAETVIFTCGALLNEERVKELKEAGLWALCVSLDHHVPEKCDEFRGKKGAFDAAMKALALGRKYGFYTMTGSVATRDFVEEERFLPLYNLARSMGVQEFRIVEPMPCGRLKGADENTLLNPSHIQRLRDFHVRTNRKGKLPKVCAFNHVESPEFFGCGGGTQHLFIDPAGDVCPCDFTPLSFGNAIKEPLEDIWFHMNKAMGDAPRRDCFIQKHHGKIERYGEGHTWPLSPDLSVQICGEAGTEPLPDFFKMVTGK
jgi:MoaA/NifB/PqqE/SkfB family radical SAM enzyme